MVREIVFHLGDHKTGSTSIQEALTRKLWTGGGELFFLPNMNQKGLANALIKRKSEVGDLDGRWSNLARELSESSAEVGVVSSEVFESVDPEALRAAIVRFMPDQLENVRLIAYVRPHAERVVSSYTQALKIGNFLGTLEEFHEHTLLKGRYLFHPRFLKWRNTFGEAFTLRPMIRDHLTGKDVVHDFLDYVFRGAHLVIQTNLSSNQTLTIADLAVMRAFHGVSPNGASLALRSAHGRAGWHFSRQLGDLASAGTSDRPRLHRALAERLISDYAADAAALDEAFFASSTPMSPILNALNAAPALACDTPQSFQIEDHFDAECCRLVRVWSSLAGYLMMRRPNEWGTHFGKLWRADGDPTAESPEDDKPDRRNRRKDGAVRQSRRKEVSDNGTRQGRKGRKQA